MNGFRCIKMPVNESLCEHVRDYCSSENMKYWPTAEEPIHFSRSILYFRIKQLKELLRESMWIQKRPSETCRVLFQNKINLRCCASGWFYYRNILRCTVLQTSNVLMDSYVIQPFEEHACHEVTLRSFAFCTYSVIWTCT